MSSLLPTGALPPARYEFELDGRLFLLEGPPEPDDLVRSAVDRAEREPAFWCHCWPSALILARFIADGLWVSPESRVLEVGCGLGLAGIVAAARGASVTMTDLDPSAIEAAEANAHRNGVTASCRVFDWNTDPDPAWDPAVILGADVLYFPHNHAPLARLIARTGAVGLFSDPNRPAADGAADLFRSMGLHAWSTTVPGGRILVVQ